jgi:hypothetical protein
MSQDPSELLESACDEETFLQFLLALAADREESAAEEAANPDFPIWPRRERLGEYDDRTVSLRGCGLGSGIDRGASTGQL